MLYQKTSPYNVHLPHGQETEEASEKLRSTILSDFRTLVSLWPSLSSSKLRLRLSALLGRVEQYHVLYGLKWTKEEHIKLVKTVYSIMVTPNMNTLLLERVIKVYNHLLKKKYLLKREELELEWKPLFDLLYHWEDSAEATRDLIKASPEFKSTLKQAIRYSRGYFPSSATAEMLSRWRPMLCPYDRFMTTALKYFNLFLPTGSVLEPETSYKLWLNDLLRLWGSYSNHPSWETDLTALLSRLALNNRGRIDWSPHVERMFVSIMNSLALPVTYGESGIRIGAAKGIRHYIACARWIVSAMEGGRGLVQSYLTRLLTAIESYFQPANYNSSSEVLHAFVAQLASQFVMRVHSERHNTKFECKTPESARLTDDDITSFVSSLKPIAFHVLWNPHDEERRSLFNALATLRPEMILPPLMDRLRLASESLTEPHRMTACLATMSMCSRVLVENYPEYVLETMDLLLPGINVNDIYKCTDIFVLLSDFLEMIWVVDFSNPATRPRDEVLSEKESEILVRTSMFEDYVAEFTDKCITLVENSSREQTRIDNDVNEDSLNDEELAIDCSVTDVFQRIMAKCSPKIFDMALNKLKRYVPTKILDPTVASYVLASMIKGCVAVRPEPVLDFFLPHLCGRVESALESKVDDKNLDAELQFSLVLLSEVVSIRSVATLFSGGSYMLKYLDRICAVLDKTLNLPQKEEYELASSILQNTLYTLIHIRPLGDRTSHEGSGEYSREAFQWAPASHPDTIAVKWYVPGREEMAGAQRLLEKYLEGSFSRLEAMLEGKVEMEKEERLRHLRLVYRVVYGTSEILEGLRNEEEAPTEGEGEEMFDGMPWVKGLNLTFRGRPVRAEALKLSHQLKEHILKECPDDTDSLSCIVTLLDTLLQSFGLDEDDLSLHIEDYKAIKGHRMNKLVRSKKHLPSIIRERVLLQLEIHLWMRSLLSNRTLPPVALHDLMDLSISHYHDVRATAQTLLFRVFARTDYFSYHKILPKLLECLDPSKSDSKGGHVTHQMLKGALYVISGDPASFCYEWSLVSKLYPALVLAQHSDRPSIVELLKDFAIRTNRTYTDCNIFTLPVKTPVLPAALKSLYATDSNGDNGDVEAMDVDMVDECSNNAEGEIDEDYIKLETKLVELINSKNLHWRHSQMAMGLLLTILHPAHKPSTGCLDLWLRALTHDDRQLRQWGFQVLEILFRMHKPRKGIRNKVKLAPPAIAGSPTVRPGPRQDNAHMQYRPMTGKELEAYWAEPFTPKLYLGYSWYPEPCTMRVADKEGEERLPENQVDKAVKECVLGHFSQEAFLDKFFHFNSLEHRKGEDSFSMDKGLFYKIFYELFGEEMLPKVFPRIKELVKSDNESKQRCAAEMLFGIIRGSRFWSFSRCQELAKELKPIFMTVLDSATSETIEDWETCLSSVTNKHDINRLGWLVETLLDPKLLFGGQGSFKESTVLRCLDKTLLFNWKAQEAQTRAYEAAAQRLDHPYNKMRQQISKLLGNVMVMDIQYFDEFGGVLPPSEPDGSEGSHRHPTRKAFIESVSPKLMLNVANPELNGIKTVNGGRGRSATRSTPEKEKTPKKSKVVATSTPKRVTRRSAAAAAANDSASTSEDVSMDDDDSTAAADDDSSTLEDSSSSDREEDRLLQTVSSWLCNDIHTTSTTINVEVYRLLPFFCQYIGTEATQDASQYCLRALCYLSVCVVPRASVPTVLEMVHKVAASPSYKAKMSILEFVQVFTFTNFMGLCRNEEAVKSIQKVIVELIADDHVTVRDKSAKILSGFAHSGFLSRPEQLSLITTFRKRIRTKMTRKKSKSGSGSVFTRPADPLTKDSLAQFHSGVLGLCAFVLAFPYDVPEFVPGILMELGKHLHDPQPVPKTIKKCLSEFKRTHQDNWEEHKLKFTEDQLVVMTDLLVSPNYYA